MWYDWPFSSSFVIYALIAQFRRSPAGVFTDLMVPLKMISFSCCRNVFGIWWKFSRGFILYSYLFIHFCVKEHQNYFGIDENLGPVAVSIRREKVEDAKEKEGSQFNYRIVFRTSEVMFIPWFCKAMEKLT